MKLYQIAEALSVVLEINQDDTKRMASFHIDTGGNIDIDIYPEGIDSEHIMVFSAWSFGVYEMREHLDIEQDEIRKENYKTFNDLIEAVRGCGFEPSNVQAHRQGRSVSRIPAREV